MPEWVIAIISIVIGTLLGFGLNLWRDNILEKKNKNQKAIEKHFEELKQTIIMNILKIISGVINNYGTLEASTLRGNRTIDDPPFPLIFGFEELDEYQAFQTHYPETDKTWRGLTTNIYKQNEDISAALQEIEEYINSNPDFPPIKAFTTPTEEKVMPETINIIYQTIYSIAQGQTPRYDFSKLNVSEFGNYQQISISSQIIAITSEETIEKCKSAFLELQNSNQFHNRVLGLGGNAFQLMMQLKDIAFKLNNIYSYGLLSNKEEQKFELNRNCVICKNLFDE